MPRALARVAAASLCLAALAPLPLAAQATPYLTFDDPRLPQLEHLIARGDIADPSPMVRPFRRGDAVRVLEAADTLARGVIGDQIRALLASLRDPGDRDWWRVEARGGAQAFTDTRRDVLHQAGDPARPVRPYADFRFEGRLGPLVLATRPAWEPRLKEDPDWPGRRDALFLWRFVDAYAAVQTKYGDLWAGQRDLNWGPVTVPGIGVGNYRYNRPAIGFDLGNRTIRLQAMLQTLGEARDTSGARINRFFSAHRLAVRLSDRVTLGVWETFIASGVGKTFEGRFANPFAFLLLLNQYGLGDAETAAIVGVDAHWRVTRAVTAEVQFGLKDLQLKNVSGPTRYPNRYGVTLTAFGPLGRDMGWRATYVQGSSLMYRSGGTALNFVDAGVGIGQPFASRDQLTLQVSKPLRWGWVVTPDLTFQRQGEGRISDPLPDPVAAGRTPTLFIGIVERTYRAGVTVTGVEGPLELLGTAGVHRVTNADNVAGAVATRVVARVQATLRWGRRGTFRE